ncbi:MAG TPA: squalene/phytoene synthase family protein [Rhodopila sp.]|uniref:squalene/phytoene synthase family protein n=1 Tax=Rhodopila sp. TaxID=2480087 RepID=UPI002B8E087E|nr:squalene/phytoene synthase family protein [Rhodopila sp.]HVY15361.1 squalene/phytoene synthase family protein [Rhodopila sp.]
MNQALADLVRKHDPDRFLTVLLAPPDRRDALLTLYAFNNELARARSVASEPPLALIRLQWWREVVEGERKRHEVATPLSEAIEAGHLTAEDLLPLIDARDQEAYGEFTMLDDWRNWLLAGAGGLAVAAGRAVGAGRVEALRGYGAAYGVAALLRATGALASQGRCLLPQDLLAQHGLSPEAFVHDPSSVAARAVLAHAVREGTALLRAATPLPRPAAAAALPAVLARRDFARWPRLRHPRGLGDRLAVITAGLTHRP